MADKSDQTPDTPLAVYHGSILDLGMADRTQVELFSAVGRTKGPFNGVVDWPFLNGVIEQRSRELLTSQGEETWRTGGGRYGDDSKPTFDRRSVMAEEIVQALARAPGGFIWTDSQGTGWAVRLISLHEPSSYAGLAISWSGGGRVIDPLAREEYRRAVEQQMAELNDVGEQETRRRLQDLADRLWLYERGEQLIWAIYAAVLRQGSSVVLLPDVALGQIIWGGNRASWPANWRNTIMDVLMSLNQLYLAALRIGGADWKPKFTMRSVAVAHCEHVEATQRQGQVCQPDCPLWNQSVVHHHFRVQIGYGFLGLLESFVVRDDKQGSRQFDFDRKPAGQARKLITDARKQGQIVSVHLPTKVFGPSAWTGLTQGQNRIIQALVREVTRAKTLNKSNRRDRAEVLIGKQVPDIRGRPTTCPFLLPDGRYVSFNGNGVRSGRGYLVIGNKGNGWLARCGYLSNDRDDTQVDMVNAARSFLSDLSELAGLLDLTVVGVVRGNEQWINLPRMLEIAEVADGLDSLREIHLRVYGPEDFHDRLRNLLAERGQFATVPGGDSGAETRADGPLMGDADLDLKVRLRRAGLKQSALARHLGVSPGFVSKLFRGKKSWPPGTRESAEAFVGGNGNFQNT